MKKIQWLVAILFAGVSCNSSDDKNNLSAEPLPAQDLMNVAYGNDPQQKMDVYLPAGRNADTKVFVLVHGGGWTEGSRSDFNYVVPMLKTQFPEYAIVNIDYRLATAQSPGLPKQIDDISLALDYIENQDYQLAEQYAFIGASAGAHLSLLYAYEFDTNHKVKAVCSIVGPTDFTDPAYTGNPLFQYGLVNLVGPIDYFQNPEPFIAASPATHVSASSPPTILFYGGQDPLIPVSQATRLKSRLDEFNVYNEYYLYTNGGHGNWNATTMLDFQTKLVAFFAGRF